jgi:hypothetical protein
MKKSKTAVKMVCAQYCPYHKPGINEEFECRGFAVAQRFIEAGTKVPRAKPGAAASPGSAIAEALKEGICKACPFFVDDCDFISTGGKALPCGGLAFISHLLRSGVITIDEVTDVISLA